MAPHWRPCPVNIGFLRHAVGYYSNTWMVPIWISSLVLAKMQFNFNVTVPPTFQKGLEMLVV